MPTKFHLAKAMVFSVVMYGCELSLSCILLFATPWTVAPQAPLSLGFSRQEYWSGLPFHSPWMWELDYKESWVLKNWCLWSVVLEKILESPLDSKEIQPVHPKGNQFWIFIGKDSDAGRDWGQEEKGTTENEIVGWHHWLEGHEFEQALGDGEGQGSLACCSPWGHKELDVTKQLKNNKQIMSGNIAESQ